MLLLSSRATAKDHVVSQNSLHGQTDVVRRLILREAQDDSGATLLTNKSCCDNMDLWPLASLNCVKQSNSHILEDYGTTRYFRDRYA